jgi:hypothetical protein
MSYARALSVLQGKPTDRVSRFEVLDHPAYMEELIGYDPWSNPLQAYLDAYRALDLDWATGVPRHSVRFDSGESARRTADGTVYTEWGLSGSSWREEYLFHDVESVLAFEPLVNTEGEELVTVESNQERIDRRRSDQELLGDSVLVSGSYYTTLFQFPIMVFGWELFLIAAASEPERFQRVLVDFAEVSRRNLAAWAAEGTELLLVHDDIAMERGLVFRPQWYRERLFPLYEYLLEPLMERSDLQVAFVSDGNYGALLDDLVSIGFDGFVINSPAMDLGEIAGRLGDRVFLAGGIDTKVLTSGTPEEIVEQVNLCWEKVRPARGFFLHSGGDLPHNIPLDNIRAYFDASQCLGNHT